MAKGLVLREVPLLFPCCAGTRRGQGEDKHPALRAQAQGRAAKRLGVIYGLVSWMGVDY
jgi:hypothetical protein